LTSEDVLDVNVDSFLEIVEEDFFGTEEVGVDVFSLAFSCSVASSCSLAKLMKTYQK
jgi:hypothetical protein